MQLKPSSGRSPQAGIGSWNVELTCGAQVLQLSTNTVTPCEQINRRMVRTFQHPCRRCR
jgi:hypothetical protein